MIPQDNGINPFIVESIVRDLAKCDPVVMYSNEWCTCPLCGQTGWMVEHDGDCVWLRAKKAVGE